MTTPNRVTEIDKIKFENDGYRIWACKNSERIGVVVDYKHTDCGDLFEIYIRTLVAQEVMNGLKYMNAEARDGLSSEELVKSWVRYWTNRSMDLQALTNQGG